MSLAASMKSMVEDIRTSAKDRHAFVADVQKGVKELLARFEREMKDTAKELKAMAAELEDFLANSEKARKEDFAVMMKDISGRLDAIRKWQKDVRKDAQALMKEYADDRVKAAEYWRSLGAHAGEVRRGPGRPPKREKEEEGGGGEE